MNLKKRCYEKCLEGSIKIVNNTVINDYFCKPICTEENPFEYIYTQECVKNCPIKDMKQNTCIQNYKKDKKEEESESDKENQEENKEEDTKERIRPKRVVLKNKEDDNDDKKYTGKYQRLLIKNCYI